MRCTNCCGTGKIKVDEPAAYGYMPCDECDGHGGMCDECGRPMDFGDCKFCNADRIAGDVFVAEHEIPWDRR
jgi:hypothetical protein